MAQPKKTYKEKIASILGFNGRFKDVYASYKLLRKLLDKKSYSLDIPLTSHCNLKCFGCLHFSPIADSSFADITTLEKDLKKIEKVTTFFHVVNLIGGEPLLNPQLDIIFPIIRKTFKKNTIRLITNGVLLNKMPDKFWESARNNDITIALSLYPVLNGQELEQILIDNGVRYELYGDRSGSWVSFLLDKEKKNTFSHFLNCKGNQFSWQLIDGKITFCGKATYSKHLNKRFGTDYHLDRKDVLPLDKGISKLKLWRFAFRPKKFCGYCHFPQEDIKWTRSEGKINEWVK